MIKPRTLLILILLPATSGLADHNLHFNGGFESGQLRAAGSTTDGFFLQTLPDPQGDVDFVNVGAGGAGPNSGLDTRVISSELVGSETVQPRRGDYFLRSAIYFDKDYSRMPNNLPEGRNKPRSTLAMGADSLRYDFDEEGYVGFSIYTPSNYEHETGVNDNRGSSMLLSVNTTPRSSQFVLSQYVRGSHDTAHWWFMYNVSDESHLEGNASTWVDLGPVEPDLAKWTDFVIRFRMNPFSIATNPGSLGIPKAKNKTYQGNKGILQIWKAEGTLDRNGNRLMVLKLNKVNTPIGLVPHESMKILHSFRVYKFGWHYNPTDVTGPVWYGFDEIRYGLAGRDGTGYSDVHPSGLPCTDGCPTDTNVGHNAPRPPTNLRSNP